MLRASIYLIAHQAHDVAKLITVRDGAYALSCGLDFYYSHYDLWVSRDLAGEPFTQWYPFVRHEASAAAVRADRPFRAMCCWSGIAVMKAGPFFRVCVLCLLWL